MDGLYRFTTTLTISIIISELFLEEKKKTIHPLGGKQSGLAGGAKYRCQVAGCTKPFLTLQGHFVQIFFGRKDGRWYIPVWRKM